ncbi:FAD-dependent oxidoreductase [Kribbella sandramycini]|uniref:FAD-dependent oxidoreductase n=1 Tax=Kribbella sandramycini TaxID=60450 RepID=UPI0031E2A150
MTSYLADPTPGTPIPVTVDGHPVPALAGQTVAAVLLAAGRDTWRTTRIHNRPRGVFCGIGACFDCLVVVNGTPDIRACQRAITPGDTITTQPGAVLPEPPGDAPASASAETTGGCPGQPGGVVTGQHGVVLPEGCGSPGGVRPSASAGTTGGCACQPGVATQDGAVLPAVGGGEALVGTSSEAVGATAGGRVEALASGGVAAGGVAPARGGRGAVVADVVVVGGGPGGMAAVLGAAEVGASVVLVDAGQGMGGQFHRQAEVGVERPGKGFAGVRERLLGHERVEWLGESSVWAVEGKRVWVQRGAADAVGRAVFAVDARAVVLATGAYDRVLPFPGWDLPGVYTAGAAQALAKGQRIGVGRRVVVAGTGPFLLPVAESLLEVGARIAGLFEANTLRTIGRGWASAPLVAASKLPEFLKYAGALARHRVPVRHGWAVVEAHGDDHVESVTVARIDSSWTPIPGTRRRISCDALCVSHGFIPNLELATAAGCELSDGVVRVDSNQQTTTPGVFAAGELTGIGGAALAAAEGRVAGVAAARHAGFESTAQEDLKKTRSVVGVLSRAYPVGDGAAGWVRGETVVCRCEEVRAIDLVGVEGEGRVFRLGSRMGLGMCQGRVCSGGAVKRVVAVPVRLGDLADDGGESCE